MIWGMVEKENTQGKITARFIRRKEVINGFERMMRMLDIFTKSHYHALTYHHHCGPHYLLSVSQCCRNESCQNVRCISRSLEGPMRVENIQINYHNHPLSH